MSDDVQSQDENDTNVTKLFASETVTSDDDSEGSPDEPSDLPESLEFDFPTLDKPKIAIVGFATGSVHKAPYTDPEVETWGINQLWKVVDKKFDRWFELHSLYEFYHSNPGHKEFLQQFEGPVYVREEDYTLALKWGIKNAQPFPHRVILDNFRPYFTNTISWLLALAIMMRPEWLGIYGVDMAQDNVLVAEYSEQRPSCEYFLGIAEGTGIELDIPNGCDLLGGTHLYGYEDSGRVLEKMGSRFVELDLNKAQIQQQLQQLDAQTSALRGTITKLDGAQAEINYWKKNWVTQNAEPEKAD